MTLPHLPQYISPQSILVVNKQGLMKRLYCPFGVLTNQQIGTIPSSTRMIVEEVLITLQDILVYIINGKQYHHSNFHILIQF